MNKQYRIVWSESAQQWRVASELTTSHGPSTSVSRRVVAALAWGLALLGSASAWAAGPAPTQLPSGGQIVAGQAAISQSASVLTVNQTSQRAALDWQSFNVGSAAQVNFNQPSSSSVTLNRVLDSNASQIYGRITAVGQVFLVNPGGVYFAPSASVEVGGLMATTHSLSTDDFMAGRSTLVRNGATGRVVNDGSLRAGLGGYIALLAPEVRNNGVVVAQMGSVVLAAGEAYTLQFEGTGLLSNVVVAPATVNALVENGNAVQAPGGLIILSAQAASRLQSGVVNNTGSLQASGVVSDGGRILLRASDRISHSGTIQADAAPDSAGQGGNITLIADLNNPGSLTAVSGRISAQAGNLGGAGGFVETSASHLSIDAAAHVNAAAPKGKAGEWLLDPVDITIQSSGDTTVAASGGTVSPASTTTVDVTALNTALSGGNTVTIATSGGTDGSGDITINAAISKTAGSTGSLTLTADRNIIVNAAISASGTNVTLPLTLNAAGTISGNASGTLNTNGGLLTLNAGASSGTLAGVISGTGDLTKTGAGTTVLSGANTYTGVTTISAGVLSVSTLANGGSASGIGASTNAASNLVLDGGTLQYTGTGGTGGTTDHLFTLTGNGGTLDSSGTGGLTISNTGAIAHLGGATPRTLILGGNTGATFNPLLTDSVPVTGMTTLQRSSASTGTNWVIKNSSNSYSGGTIISTGGGGMLLNAPAAFGTGTVTVSNKGFLNLNTSGTVSNAFVMSGVSSAAPQIWKQGGTAQLILTGSISGGQYGLIYVTSGTLVLQGSVNFTGEYRVNASSTLVMGGQSLTFGTLTGAGTVSLNGASDQTLTIGVNNASQTFSGVIQNTTGSDSGKLSLVKAGTGTVTLSGNLTYTGSTTINTGALIVTGSLSDSTLVSVSSGATYNVDISDTIAGLSGVGTVTTSSSGSKTLTLNVASDSQTFSGVVSNGSGSLSLTKMGAGTQVLSGASNSYTGVTTISEGVLSVSTLANGGANSGIGAATNVASNLVLDGGTLQYTGSGVTIDRLFTLTDKGGTLDASGTGTLSVGSISSLGYSGTSTRTLTLTGTGTGVLVPVLANNTGVTSLTKASTGTWTLYSSNTYTGTTTVAGGTLKLNNLSTTSSATFDLASGATLKLDGGPVSIPTLTGSGYLSGGTVASTVTLGGGGGTQSFSGLIRDGIEGGKLSVVKTGSGALTLSAANTYTGSTTINAGTLIVTGSLSDSTVVTLSTSGAVYQVDVNDTIAGLAGVSGTTVSTSTAGLKTLVVNQSGNSTFDGVIANGSGSLALLKTGSGTLTLSGANTYTGATTISGGTLSVSSLANGGASSGIGASSNAAANLILDSGTLKYTGAAASTDRLFNLTDSGGSIDASGSGALSWTNTGSLAYTGTSTRTLTLMGSMGGVLASVVANNTGATGVTKSGTGSWTLSGTNTYTGVTTISGGTLSVSSLANGNFNSNIGASSNNASNLVLDGGTLRYTGAAVSTNRLFTLGSSGFIDASGSGILSWTNTGSLAYTGTSARTLTLLGSMGGVLASVVGNNTGATSVTKSGTGSWTLSGTNTYTGVTTISGGTLSVSSLASGGSNSNIGASSSVAANLVLDGGTLKYTGGAVSTDRLFTITLNGGTLDASGSGTLTFANTTNLTYSGASARTLTLTGTGSGYFSPVIADGADLTSVVKNGAGTWTVAGQNSYSGVTTVNAGTYKLSGANAIALGASVKVDGGILDLGGEARTFGSFSGAGGVVSLNGSTDQTLTFSGSDNTSYAGILQNGSTGVLSLTKTGAGVLTLSGTNTYTGLTVIQAGTLQIGSGGAGGTLGSGNVTNNASLIFNRNADTTISNVITGSGSVLATITGNLVLSASASITSTSNDIVLSASGNFINNAGSSVLSATAVGKRWLVYSADPTLNTFGSLNSGNKALWGVTYATLGPASVSSGNRYVFSTSGGTVTASTLAGSKTYGDAAISLVDRLSYTVSGKAFSDGNLGGAYISNDFADAISTVPVIASTGNTVGANASSSYVYTFTTNGAANTGFSFTSQNTAQFTVNKATVSLSGISKTYDGTTSKGNTTLTISGVNGETLSLGDATYSSKDVASNGSNHLTVLTLANNGSYLASNYQVPALTVSNAPATTNCLH